MKWIQFIFIAALVFCKLPSQAGEFQLPTYQTITGQAVTRTGDYRDLNGYESGTRVLGFEVPWSKGLAGQGEIIAIADSGLDTGEAKNLHPDFAGQIFGVVNLANASDGAKDMASHGTHVAGIAVGTGRASAGLIKGGAFGAKAFIQKIAADGFIQMARFNGLVGIMDSAYRAGARTQVLSWSDSVRAGAYGSLAAEVDRFTFQHPDFLMVVSAGNYGRDQNGDGRIDNMTLFEPATAKNALVVGASENLVHTGGILKQLGLFTQFKSAPFAPSFFSDNPNGLAAFSGRGPTLDGRLKPDLVASGTNLLAPCSRAQGAGSLWGRYNSYYCWAGGTSSAAPFVAAGAAIVRQYLRLNKRRPSAPFVKAILMNTASEMFPGQYGLGPFQEIRSRRPNFDEGFGRLNMAQATALESAILLDETQGVAPGKVFLHKFRLNSASALVSTLVYNDVPGAQLINDLDLVVETLAGKVIATGADRLNNLEHLEFSLPPGDYQLKVVPKRLAPGQKTQPFALVVRKAR